MKRLICYILLLMSISCLGSIKPHNEILEETEHLFEEYLGAFKKQILPFNLDRKAVFGLMNADTLPEIKDSLKIFIPDELKNSEPNSTYRCLCLLPKYNGSTVVLIQQNFKSNYDENVIKTHMITYNTDGEVLDYQELAGATPDIWEAFLEINNEYKIKRKLYQFMVNTDKEQVKFFHLVETCYEYVISNAGLIEETEESKREGYFEGDWTGYNFVKPIKP